MQVLLGIAMHLSGISPRQHNSQPSSGKFKISPAMATNPKAMLATLPTEVLDKACDPDALHACGHLTTWPPDNLFTLAMEGGFPNYEGNNCTQW
jgi:hypothetical protein